MADYAFFYNSENGDRVYNADSFSDWLKKFFTTGVFQGDLQVVANEGMNIKVTSGYTNIEGKVRIFDSNTDLVIENANPTYNRIDTVVVERNDTDRNITLKVVTGGYSSTPTPTAPVRANGVYQLVLAQVYVAAGATAIVQSAITDKRTDNTVCGLVVTPIDNFDFQQFTLRADAYIDEFERTSQASFNAWEVAQKTAFDNWFNNLVYVLDGDVAGHLQNEIDTLNAKVDNIKLVHLVISYDSSLAGAIITATNGEETHTATATNSGQTIIDGMNLGAWIISENVYSTSATVSATYYGNYSASIGGDRFITVTYDSAFAGSTITCTNGTDTQTRVASGGSVVFCFANDGTYTISGEASGSTYTTSIVVSGAGSYSANLQTNITLSLTVYSASNDTVYYKENGSNVTLCTTDVSGKGNATLIIPPSGKNITLYSTIAKDTTNGTSAYNKTISLSKNTTSIKLMPNDVCYWYGCFPVAYRNGGAMHCSEIYGNVTPKAFTVNTNSLTKNSDGQGTRTTGNQIEFGGFTITKRKLKVRLSSSDDTYDFSGKIASGSTFYANALTEYVTSPQGMFIGVYTESDSNIAYLKSVSGDTVKAMWFE